MGSQHMTFSNYFRSVQSYHKVTESIVFLMRTNPNVASPFFNLILWRYIEGGGKPNYCITEIFVVMGAKWEWCNIGVINSVNSIEAIPVIFFKSSTSSLRWKIISILITYRTHQLSHRRHNFYLFLSQSV